jgi:hypothetical protein
MGGRTGLKGTTASRLPIKCPRSNWIPTSSRVSRIAVPRRSGSSGSCRPPGRAMCPDHGSPSRSDRRIRRMASGPGATIRATAAHFRTGWRSELGGSAEVRWERRASRSASANAIGSHLHSNFRPVGDRGDCSRAAGRHWKKGAREGTGDARAHAPSSEGKSPADYPAPAVQIGCRSRYTGSRKWACRSFAVGSSAVKWRGR